MTSTATLTTPARSRRDKNRVIRVTDETGRVLGVRRPGVVQRMRMLEAVGAENAGNQSYLNYALVAISVVEIDGEICEPVVTKRQLEARALQLDEEGLEAVSAALFADAASGDGAASVSPEELAKNV